MVSKCAKMPVGLTFGEAFGIPSMYAIAIHSLMDFARLLTTACFVCHRTSYCIKHMEKCRTEGHNWYY